MDNKYPQARKINYKQTLDAKLPSLELANARKFILPAGNAPKKKISNYYNDYYSNQNFMLNKNAKPIEKLKRYVEEEDEEEDFGDEYDDNEDLDENEDLYDCDEDEDDEDFEDDTEDDISAANEYDKSERSKISDIQSSDSNQKSEPKLDENKKSNNLMKKFSTFFPINKNNNQKGMGSKSGKNSKSFDNSLNNEFKSNAALSSSMAGASKTPKVSRRVIFADECMKSKDY